MQPCRDLRRRVEELQASLAGTQQQALEEKLAAAETRVKQLVGTLARKDTALKDCREKLEAAEGKLEEAGRAVGAPAEELERQVKMVGRLRAELARKDMALQVGRSGWGTAECCDGSFGLSVSHESHMRPGSSASLPVKGQLCPSLLFCYQLSACFFHRPPPPT